MAAKKTSKKKVTVELDAEEIIAFLEAAEKLTEIATAKIMASSDPTLQREAKKRAAKKGAAKKSKK